jgi:UPF0755 protein
MKKPQSTFFFISILSACCMLGLWLFFLYVPIITQSEGATYYLRPGTSKKMLVSELKQQGIFSHSKLFSLYIYFHFNSQLKTGEYFFAKGSTLDSMWIQMTTGKGLVYHPFTIIPGWSFTRLRQELQTSSLNHQTAQLNDKQIMESLGSPYLPEGEFFPDTYYYTKGISDLIILKKAFLLRQQKLNSQWQHRAPQLPYKDPYEALIAASLIEKEAHLSSERPIIAGVLINRLRKDMLLQFDPTVIYGMGERYTGKIYKNNLTEDTAYNTYLHKGLPPTPIAMPSDASVEAALHPQENDYFYFVARGYGSHQFSKTLVEHKAATATLMEMIKQQHAYFNETKVSHYLDTFIIGTLRNYSQNSRPSKDTL